MRKSEKTKVKQNGKVAIVTVINNKLQTEIFSFSFTFCVALEV